MPWTSLAARLGPAALLVVALGSCAGSGFGVPRAVADADPIPSGCPPTICPRHTPTQPPPPSDEPEPAPTATASKPGKPRPAPKPTRTAGGTTAPGDPTPGPTATAGTKAPVAPSSTRITAFPFSGVPYPQAFPLDPPPPPPPRDLPPPVALVAFAAVLAASVAAATSMTSRRRLTIRAGPEGSVA